MKTKNIDESLGYVKAIKDVIKIAGELTNSSGQIDACKLVDRILIGEQDLSKEESEYYTMDMIDPNNHTKVIAGEDALFLNPIYNLNK